MNKAALAKWKRDAVAFIEEVLINPETSAPFELYVEEKPSEQYYNIWCQWLRPFEKYTID
jgi:hypothetical protein